MIRLKDIAERAGVSIMTVSKALRDATDISPATKARLRALATEMNYLPDAGAQGLRARSSRLFGLVISAVTNPFLARVVMAIEEKAGELGYGLILCQTGNCPQREETVIRQLLARRVDGVFVTPVYRFEPRAPVYEALGQSGIPTVLLGHAAPFCRQFVGVETDDIQGGYRAARHLLSLGHRRIAFLAGPRQAPWAQERLDGYRRAVREAGLEEDRLVFNAGATIQEGERAALEMLNESTRTTAVQAVNDSVAIGAASILARKGIRIPEDISMIGYGDILLSQHGPVPLTTMHQPKFRIGTEAVGTMLRLLDGGTVGSRRLGVELVVRSSTAAVAQVSDAASESTTTKRNTP
jgi:DNA-binding LacI/PurR family transcriptional regulator